MARVEARHLGLLDHAIEARFEITWSHREQQVTEPEIDQRDGHDPQRYLCVPGKVGTGDQEYGNHWQQTEPIKRTKDPPDNVHIDPLKSPYEIHNTELG